MQQVSRLRRDTRILQDQAQQLQIPIFTLGRAQVPAFTRAGRDMRHVVLRHAALGVGRLEVDGRAVPDVGSEDARFDRVLGVVAVYRGFVFLSEHMTSQLATHKWFRPYW